MDNDIYELAVVVGKALAAHNMMVATAESCTGGWVATALTAVPGSSAWLERGFVTYSNAAKCEMLGVGAATIAHDGAVSEAVVREMASGALNHSHAGASVAVSGIAGPDGGTPVKPVGTVCFGWALSGGPAHAATEHFAGDREVVRKQSVVRALRGLMALLERGR